MSFEGSCHCGAVSFTVDAPTPQKAISCNCSHCRRKGFLLAFVPASIFRLERGEEDLKSYLFNTRHITHRFCAICGTEPFACGTGPDGAETRAINLRCVPDLDLDSLEIQKVDGASR